MLLRPWTADDAGAALSFYGNAEVARWLAPAVARSGDEEVMRVVLQRWMAEDERMLTPAGRWTIDPEVSPGESGGLSSNKTPRTL